MMLTRKPSSADDLQRRSRSLSPPPRQRNSEATRCRSLSQQRDSSSFKRDKHHHLHHVCPRTGPLFVLNRASKFHSSTSLSHASDLTTIFEDVELAQKPVLCLIVDGGPDQNPTHLTNFLSYGRLWRDQQLDCLIVATHAPWSLGIQCDRACLVIAVTVIDWRYTTKPPAE